MKATIELTQRELIEFFLRVAVVRPVFVWGQPGIGKTELTKEFGKQVGMPVVALVGSQLAPEDLIGVPMVQDGVSRFFPPAMIARKEPFILFLDELNGASLEIQRAFFSLVAEGRVGEFTLPEGSVVIAAGNRAEDNAMVKPMPAPLINRFVHAHLRVSHRDWLDWARDAGVHPWILDYIEARPAHLVQPAPKTEEPFSTPRSWHQLSDALLSWGDDVDDQTVRRLAYGTQGPARAQTFVGYVKKVRRQFDLGAILKGEKGWPRDPRERDILYFLAMEFRSRLVKELPPARDGATDAQREFAHQAKGQIAKLAEISFEVARQVVGEAEDDDVEGNLPDWFLTEVVRDVPRLALAPEPT